MGCKEIALVKIIWKKVTILKKIEISNCFLTNLLEWLKFKIMFNVQKSPPNIIVTRNLWSARVWVWDWLCKEKTHHFQCTLPKINCIVVWLFLGRVSIHWLCLRFKVDLSSWESLYLIKLNPNRSKVWILA